MMKGRVTKIEKKNVHTINIILIDIVIFLHN